MTVTPSFTWDDPLDPREIKDYDYSLGTELTENADTLLAAEEEVTWTLSAQAIAGGLLIHASQHDVNGVMVVWLKVSPTNYDDTIFDAGTPFQLSFTANTTGGRRYHRTGVVTVKHL